jgi:hypothetical protein
VRTCLSIVSVLVFASALTVLSTSTWPARAASLSRQDAASRAQSAGFMLISKTEQAPGAWDVWASKDGIAYEVKINANDGSLIAAVPVEDND